jgi:hypothetical protein
MISQRLAAGDPGNAQWQHDLFLSDTMIAAVLKDEGKLDAALSVYRDCLTIAERLTKAHPGDSSWQDALRFSINQIDFPSCGFVVARAFALALEAVEQAISLAPDIIWFYTNRAHALMFLDRTDEARALYLQYRGQKNVEGQKSWEVVILEDFAEFRKVGLARPLMDEIEKQFAEGG